MNVLELFLIAVGLSMDAFAVSICKGLSIRKADLKKSIIIGLYFGGFQAGMPLIGYLLGSQFADKIIGYDHWIAFILLGIIGANMIKSSFSGEGCTECDIEDPLTFSKLLPLAVATSIDALAVGVSFAFLQVHIVTAISLIGIITFTLSGVGLKIGNVFGETFKSKAELVGGIILILMGSKILLEHLGMLA